MGISELYKIYLQHPNIITDTRKIEEGCLFFALKGDRFDGNKFAEEALKKGAVYAIVDDNQLDGDHYLQVEDVLMTLQKLAHYHREQLQNPIIAITGSNGKTTTKELLFAVLKSEYRAFATKGNLNNHIGVPLTLLSIPRDIEVAIIEMGANHQGEIAFLAEIAAPTHGLITNIGKAHLEGFGGLEGVKKGKGELYRYLEINKGIAFVNLDEPHLSEMAGKQLRTIGYCKSELPTMERPVLEIQLLETDPFISVRFLDKKGQFWTSKSQLSGTYNFSNIMTAVAVGKYFKVPADKISQAIADYFPANNRSQIVHNNSNTFYLDAYNANPTSMTAALTHFTALNAVRKIAILGDMLELGDYSEEEHRKIFTLAQAGLYQKIILVGEEFKKVAPDNSHVLWFETVEALKSWYHQQGFKQTTFLLKGSRGIGMEKMLS